MFCFAGNRGPFFSEIIMKRLIMTVMAVVFINLGTHASAAGIPIERAMAAAEAAINACKAQGYAITVTILEPDLSTRIVIRADGAPAETVGFGYRKAYTVIKSGLTSGDYGKTVPASSKGPSSGPPGSVIGDPNLITWAGGLPIKSGGTIIGSMSASGAPGGEKDEACVEAGLLKLAP
jgi:uncharacterized protein GlcG (DUF336 family)